jgi:hypothetical protein
VDVIPSELRRYLEEGLYIAIGVSLTGALALRRRLRTVPFADEAATAVTHLAVNLVDDVHEVRGLLDLLRERGGGPRTDG